MNDPLPRETCEFLVSAGFRSASYFAAANFCFLTQYKCLFLMSLDSNAEASELLFVRGRCLNVQVFIEFDAFFVVFL